MMVVVCAVVTGTAARAQNSGVIAGGVFDDRAALAVRANFVPVRGATLKLYRDGGDRTPSADDAIIATTRTDAGGFYVFPGIANGNYWLVVDSRSLNPADAREAWAEQTFGPAGSLCSRADGSSVGTYFEGACVGGRTLGSDDASALVSSEHLALVSPGSSAARSDFAFSFNAVTSIADGGRIQGSLRQFVTNANTIAGPSRMRFLPLQRAPEQRQVTMGLPPRWWSIVLTSPLPELTDADTTIEGTAYNYLSPASVANVHPGQLGERATVKPEERSVPRIEKPDLEVTFNGATGIACGSRCGIGSIAVHGAATNIVARADMRLEQVMVGAAPDGTSANATETGVQIERGITYARHLFVTTQTRAGIIVGAGARLDGERLEVMRCGDPSSGGGLIVLSDGSTIRSSIINVNAGAGIILGSLDGASPAHGNTIDGSTISGNQAGVLFGPASSRNIITRNDIMWNRLGGVTSAPYTTVPPRENRVSANRFDENGLRPIVLDLGSERPNELSASAGSCARVATAVNNGISAPRLTSVRVLQEGSEARVILQGNACPGEIVELYQSYVTSGVRDKQVDLPRIRDERGDGRETLTNQQREMALPSVGEFNYLGATSTNADGSFEATFPLPMVTPTDEAHDSDDEETNIWAHRVLPGADPSDRAFSAIAIDNVGNTSEMSVRRQVD
jgi:hypothetical protein